MARQIGNFKKVFIDFLHETNQYLSFRTFLITQSKWQNATNLFFEFVEPEHYLDEQILGYPTENKYTMSTLPKHTYYDLLWMLRLRKLLTEEKQIQKTERFIENEINFLRCKYLDYNDEFGLIKELYKYLATIKKYKYRYENCQGCIEIFDKETQRRWGN